MAVHTIDLQIPDIEKELNRQWSLQKQNKDTKACLFTLIIYASDPKRVNHLQELVDSILDKFPCRIIFIKGDKGSTSSYFRVNVSNVISGHAQKSAESIVRCDQIVIDVSHDQLFRVPFLVTPHIVQDLPVYLLWGQNPFEERDIFPYMQRYARRVIFDSDCADDLKLFCSEMMTSMDTLKMDVMDINWALVSNWRDLLGELFDSPEKIEHLNAAKSIIINYTSYQNFTAEHPEIRALYLQGWLAGSLKWKFQTIEKFESSAILSYFGPFHPIIVALTPVENSGLPQGAIISIEISTLNDHNYFITRRENLPQVVVHSSSKSTCDLPFTLSLPNIHKGLNFMREIFFGRLGDHYKETLKVISKLDLKIFTQKK